MKVDTDIISSIVASPIGTSWDTSDNVCQNPYDRVIHSCSINLDLLVIPLVTLIT
jgi:hypothetical protein